LARKHYSLLMTELADVTDLLVAFEAHNNLRLEFRFSVEWEDRVPDIVLFAAAHSSEWQIGEVASLALANVRCSAMNLRDWNAALTHVLYLLDGQLAENEMSGTVRATK
jgi:hypothetical protein